MGDLGLKTVNMIDIRGDKSNKSLLEIVQHGLKGHGGAAPALPSLLLYDEKGLKLFEKITYMDEYYLTNAEIEALTNHAGAIASRIPAGARLIELGSGNLRKIKILLDAFEAVQKKVEYFALDLSYSELQRTFAELDTTSYVYVSFNGLHGTYDDGLAWLAKSENKASTTCVMSMGSSLGNFSRSDAAKFLTSFKDVLGPGDFLLIGIDYCQDQQRVFNAYNDASGITEQFYRNGLDHVNSILGTQAFKHSEWTIQGAYDQKQDRHVAHYVCKTDIAIEGVLFREGDQIHLEDAYKYSEAQALALWHQSGLILQAAFGDTRDDYFLHLLSPSTVKFSDDPDQYAATFVPDLKDWQQLWSAWDTVTRAMVPGDELANKPIKLRNNLIFYLGHIPTFADIHFTRATSTAPIDPAYYSSIFERGIDPDVDDPEKCHDHSAIPDEWPPLKEILAYAARVRARITESLTSGLTTTNRKLSRSLWLAYEHEAMHLETFLYMLLHSARVLPPPGRSAPDFGALARDAALKRDINQWHKIPASSIEVGINDAEDDLGPDRYFGWDNERPARMVDVPAFQAQSRCISNGEYARYLEATKQNTFPASWTPITAEDNVQQFDTCPTCVDISDEDERLKDPSKDFFVGKAVKTVYGLIPLKYALDWPVMASYDELAAYAVWAGGHIPTFEEARSIYNFVEFQKKGEAENMPSGLISAVNGHLCNDGVEETPPFQSAQYNAAKEELPGPSTPSKTFSNLAGCNVAFKTWHPTPVTADGARLRGQSDAGGLWEWTSSSLAPHPGFKSMDLYPGYTSDFFDGKHNICLGGSWATVPRIAGRKSFVNWYQRNYPFTWATARLARNIDQKAAA